MKNKIIILAMGIMIAGNLPAQDLWQAYTDTMSHIFEHVDKSRITTGLLSDYQLQIVSPTYFDGIPADSNYVDMSTWMMLYSGMYTSKINNNVSLTLPETVFEQIDNATHAYAIPLDMMHYQYQYNALNENTLKKMKNILKNDAAFFIFRVLYRN